MAYKDKEKQRQATRDRVQRWRANKVVTPDNNVTPESEAAGSPTKPGKLPDISILPPERIEGITGVLARRREMSKQNPGIQDDSADYITNGDLVLGRWSRAISYRLWELQRHQVNENTC